SVDPSRTLDASRDPLKNAETMRGMSLLFPQMLDLNHSYVDQTTGRKVYGKDQGLTSLMRIVRANAYVRSGKPAYAFIEIEEARRLNPNWDEIWIQRGIALEDILLFKQGMSDEVRKALFDEALTSFQKAMELNPLNPVALTRFANHVVSFRYENKDDLEKAIAISQRALDLGWVTSETYLTLGRAFFHLAVLIKRNAEDAKKNCNAAIEALDNAIRLNDNNGYSYYVRGMAYYNLSILESDSNEKINYRKKAIEDLEIAEQKGMSLDSIPSQLKLQMGRNSEQSKSSL
ncbi:MAG: hypothetical protein Q8O30_02135, partial [Candidatus Omnitrophota bacterium]|nr:hypothetical protein [Candidatus Omnitrophota bacterium]